ncbi:MAG: cytochrome c biogenesis protein CcsA [Bacteroidia bacterium]|nr:cytochrome c biogenesis protein CcsA [Bacteroidia bacterium]
MIEVAYTGENLLPGNIGHFFVALAFCAAIFSGISYFLAVEKSEFWKKFGKISFFVHTISVAGIFITLFFIIYGHYFEYKYAWQHSSKTLPWYYMLSCFWEGQEGSFLLWMFWNAIIGILLILKIKDWQSPVLAIVCITQVVLSSMLLGIEIGDVFKIGSSPFSLLRDEMAGTSPIFRKSDYLINITDGRGLNPLLQNYWMVIHPPVLFFGFASGLVPFAFAVAGLWTGKYKEWLKPALPWTIISVMLLGAGIIMGGFWAYESLSFGGYWAWDPVENASLVPWLILIAALHIMIVYKNTGTSIILTYILSIVPFLLILYATFLTRSGILGDSSVHSFTDLGLSGQLLVFMFLFYVLPLFAIIKSKAQKKWLHISYWSFFILNITLSFISKSDIVSEIIKWVNISYFVAIGVWFVLYLFRTFPLSYTEESFKNRSLWLFLGSLVLVISAFQVILVTSFPVINKIFDTNIAPPTDAMTSYNKFQLPIAVILAVLAAISQFFKYKNTNISKTLIHIFKNLVLSIIITSALMLVFKIYAVKYLILMLASVFAVLANLSYFIEILKGKIKVAGGSVAHIGFGLMLIGILVSGEKKQVISINKTVNYTDVADEKTKRENVLLLKNDTVLMDKFKVVYTKDTVIGKNTHYRVKYKSINSNEEFTLEPNAQISNEQLMANPDIKHYPTYDIYTYVSSIPDREKQAAEPWGEPHTYKIKPGDTILAENGIIIFESIDKNVKQQKTNIGNEMWAANLKIISKSKIYYAKPIFAITKNSYYTIEDQINEAGMKMVFYVKAENGVVSAYIDLSERPPVRDFIILKAIVFPYINLLWGGVIIMMAGFVISAIKRSKDYRKTLES